MSKHTQGPWSISHHNAPIADTGDYDLVTSVDGPNGETVFQFWNGNDIDEANAKLIAAAPELLDALNELLSADLTLMPSFEAGKEAQDAWADRRAAARNNAAAVILKATGAA